MLNFIIDHQDLITNVVLGVLISSPHVVAILGKHRVIHGVKIISVAIDIIAGNYGKERSIGNMIKEEAK